MTGKGQSWQQLRVLVPPLEGLRAFEAASGPGATAQNLNGLSAKPTKNYRSGHWNAPLWLLLGQVLHRIPCGACLF